MNRTKEFYDIVSATEIPQPKQEIHSFYGSVGKMYEEIVELINELENMNSYELFKIVPKIKRGYDMIKQYKAIPINVSVGSSDSLKCAKSLESIIHNNAMRATLRLNEINRRYNNIQQNIITDEKIESPRERRVGSDFSMVLMDEETKKEKNEFLLDRKRVSKSISEIGQIIEDISIHVSLQEEQLNRIDSVLVETEKWSKKALNELSETWDVVKTNRPFMFKFFGFWIFVFLIFFLLKRL